MKKILKWVGFILLALFVIAFFTNRDESNEKLSNTKMALTNNMQQAIAIMFQDDIDLSLEGKKSLIPNDYIHITAKELEKIYANNEAKGDQEFYKKKIIITGTINSINSTIGNIPVINLKTNSSFSNVMLHLAKKYRNLAAELNKNQNISFACIGGGVIIGSPVLNECQPLYHTKEVLLKEQLNLVNKFINGNNNVPEYIKKAVLLTKKMSEKSNDFKICPQIDIKCFDSIINKFNSEDQSQIQEQLKLHSTGNQDK